MEAPLRPGESMRLVVEGRPIPQGDLTAMPLVHRTTKQPIIGKGGRPVINMIHSNHSTLEPWREKIAAAARDAGWPALGLAAIDETVFVRLAFYFKRPLSHYGTGKNAAVLKDAAELWPEKTGGDADKLSRAVLDALTNVIWKDDKRVIVLNARRFYGTPERVEITVRRPRVRTVGELRALRDIEPAAAEAVASQLSLDALA